MSQIVGIGKNSIAVLGEFNGHILVTWEDFHVPKLIFICYDDNISFGRTFFIQGLGNNFDPFSCCFGTRQDQVDHGSFWQAIFDQRVGFQYLIMRSRWYRRCHWHAHFIKTVSSKVTIATIATRCIIGRCVLHFMSQMWIGKTIRLIFDLIPFLIVLSWNYNKVLIVAPAIWCIGIVLCTTVKHRAIRG